MIVRRLLGALKTRWWIPLVTTALATVVASFYVAQMPPPNYMSQARMWVSGKLRIPEGSAYVEEAALFYGTQIELMQSQNTQNRAHARVQAQHPDLKPVRVRLGVTRAPAASIFVLNAVGPDPTYPRLFLEAVMEEYLQYKREVRTETSDTTLAQVTQQLYQANEEVKAAQAKLDEFEKDKNLIVLQEESMRVNKNFQRWNMELTDKQVELQLIEDFIQLDETPEERASLGLKPSANATTAAEGERVSLNEPSDRGYTEVLRSISKLQIQRDEQAKIWKPAHPRMVAMDESLSQLKKLAETYKTESRAALIRARDGAKVKIENTKRNIEIAKAELEALAKKVQEAEKLRQQHARAQRLSESLGGLVQSVNMGQGLDQENLSIFEHASPPYAPALQKAPTVIGGAALGMALGFGIVLLLVWFDDRLGSLAELRANVDCLVVGQVPELEMRKKERKEGKRIELLQPDDQRHHFAESYRNIRSSLLFMASDGVRPKTILITSSIPSEGKSTVSSNLARAMAFAGSKVLLIEGDQRRGLLHEVFDIPSSPGLADVLKGDATVQSVIRQTALENLWFIPRGKAPRNPGELFLGHRMDEMLQEVYNQFDYVLIDSAPVLAADDTTSLAPKMDGVLFVVRNSYTSVKMLRQSMDLLNQRQVRILGVIYNRADVKGGDYNYYNYPQYHLTDGETNGKPVKKSKSKKDKGKKPAQIAEATVVEATPVETAVGGDDSKPSSN